MSSRDIMLNAIKLGKGPAAPRPLYRFAPPADAIAQFRQKAEANIATVTEIASPDEAPEAIWALLSAAGATPRLHCPADSAARALPWSRTPGLTLSDAPPSGDDTAFALADYAIAETGTLVYLSGPGKPSSWHFRPGREIALITRGSILPRFEEVMAVSAKPGAMPATINLVTGPSRTADIEQTIEYGAHGPRQLHILIAG